MTFSYFTLFTLALISLLKAQIVENVGDSVQNVVNNVAEGVQNVGDSIDISARIDQIRNRVSGLLDQARAIRQGGSNITTQKIEIYDFYNQVDITELCTECVETVNDIKDKGELDDNDPTTERAILDLFFDLCGEYFDTKYCSEAVGDFVTSVYNSVTEPSVNATWACQKLAMCPYLINYETLNPYVDDVLRDKPATNIPIASNQSTYLVLHMTDIHIDFKYQEGTWARCGGFQCCQADSGPSPNPDDPLETAGFWGGLGTCDIPSRTYEQFLRFVSENFNLSFILWTGDNIDHEVWAQSQATQLDPTRNATAYLQQFFPNTTIYPMFGNHEAFFSDQYDTVGNTDDWLKTELGTIWQSLMPQDSLTEFTTNSYYSTVNQEHNLKIISLDTQTCDTLNFELIKDSNVDPLNQLAWLRNELLDAESNNLAVFIIGHIPPGDLNCDPQWSARYRALVDRFTNIIRGQFFGHNHIDHFQILRSYSDGNPPVGVLYMTPSLSTYKELNPSFRIYEIDSETNQIVNYRQYRLNLTQANENTEGPLTWELAYNFLEEYGLNDTSYQSVDALADQLRANDTTAQTFFSNYYTGVEPNYVITQRSFDYYYCTAKNAQPHDIMICLGLDPAKTNLMYFAGEFVPGVITSISS